MKLNGTIKCLGARPPEGFVVYDVGNDVERYKEEVNVELMVKEKLIVREERREALKVVGAVMGGVEYRIGND